MYEAENSNLYDNWIVTRQFLGQCDINLTSVEDTKSRLNTVSKLYLGSSYTSEETCDPSSTPCTQNAAT